MLRCAWNVGCENECRDEAEVIGNGHGYCVAHYLHAERFKADMWRQRWDDVFQEHDRAAAATLRPRTAAPEPPRRPRLNIWARVWNHRGRE